MRETLLATADLEQEASQETDQALATRALTLVKLEEVQEDDESHIVRGLE